MHALLAHAYHMALSALHLLTLPLWRALAACVVLAAAARIAGLARSPRGAAWVCGLAVAAGWAVLAPPSLHAPKLHLATPVARLAGLALVVLAEAVLRVSGRLRWLLLLAAASGGAWWLRGAPWGGNAILNCMPVFLGFAAALPLARHLSRGEAGLGTAAAAMVLAIGLRATSASPHWAEAALIPASVAVILAGLPQATATLAAMIVMVAASAMVASDRGRLAWVDVACLAPLLVWMLLRSVRRRG